MQCWMHRRVVRAWLRVGTSFTRHRICRREMGTKVPSMIPDGLHALGHRWPVDGQAMCIPYSYGCEKQMINYGGPGRRLGCKLPGFGAGAAGS
jgi:hypothetical protein